MQMTLNRVFVLRKKQLQNAAFCKECFVFTCPTYSSVQRFLNGSVHELCGLKASQMIKVHTSCYEYPHDEKIKNLLMSAYVLVLR